MASISTDKSGNRTLRFVDPSGVRKALYLGSMPKRQCEQIKAHIEKLVSAAISRCAVADETSKWVSGLDDVLRNKLARVGLIQCRETATLGEFIDRYVAGRHDAKPTTVKNWRQAQRHLLGFLDASRPLGSITKSEAKDFRQHLIAKGFADNTIRKTCSVIRQFFADAMDRELVDKNPFKQRDVPANTVSNPERSAYVSVEDANAVLAACPNAQWRLTFALSRFAGLRCPSETLGLRWSDINWERDRMIVRSPKTERHEGKSQRVVPIFALLRPHLMAAFEEAEAGAEFVITHCRDARVNLRTNLLRIINRAGLTPWPKLFHNLRASCETDLMREFPAKPVTDWLGHSVSIAHQHYLMTSEADFDRASEVSEESYCQNPCQTVADQGELEMPTIQTNKAKHWKSNVSPCRRVPPVGVEPTT